MKVCVYAIAKDEEENVDTFMSWAKDADLVLIGDTGSSDKTKELFAKYDNVLVIDVKLDIWRFDAARNIVLNGIPNSIDICVSADLDEEFSSNWLGLVKNSWVKNVNRLEYDYQFSSELKFVRSKIHSREGYLWNYAVHEELEAVKGFVEHKVFVNNLMLLHNADQTKGRSYLNLLKTVIEENPENFQRSFWYMRELFWKSDYDGAIKEGKRFLKIIGIDNSVEKPAVYRLLGKCNNIKGNNKEAEENFLLSCEYENSPESWSAISQFNYNLGIWDSCYKNALTAYRLGKKECSSYLCDIKQHVELPLDMLSISAYHNKNISESKKYISKLVKLFPNDKRYQSNYNLIFSNDSTAELSIKKKTKKTICLCMIIKNESNIIARSLRAVKYIIDYWVIIDTGSTDNTKEIIKNELKGVSGELIERPWVDFGFNRTESLRMAKNKADYILLCDADEEMIITDFDSSELHEDAYDLKYLGNNQYWVPYLVRGDYDWKYIGVTHEYLGCEQSFTRATQNMIAIDHHCDGGCRAEKFERDIKLLEDALRKESNNSRYMFYLANSYRDIGKNKEAINWYKKRIEIGGWEQEVWQSMYQIGICELGNDKKAKESFLRAYNFNNTRAEALYELAKICRMNEDYAEGCLYAEVAMKMQMPEKALFVDSSIYRYKSMFEFSVCAYYVNRVNEAKKANDMIMSMNDIDNVTKSLVNYNSKFYK